MSTRRCSLIETDDGGDGDAKLVIRRQGLALKMWTWKRTRMIFKDDDVADGNVDYVDAYANFNDYDPTLFSEPWT